MTILRLRCSEKQVQAVVAVNSSWLDYVVVAYSEAIQLKYIASKELTSQLYSFRVHYDYNLKTYKYHPGPWIDHEPLPSVSHITLVIGFISAPSLITRKSQSPLWSWSKVCPSRVRINQRLRTVWRFQRGIVQLLSVHRMIQNSAGNSRSYVSPGMDGRVTLFGSCPVLSAP